LNGSSFKPMSRSRAVVVMDFWRREPSRAVDFQTTTETL
jgi:hypothetical protein